MLRIVGDCNFADGFFDMGFGTGSSIKKGANPFQHIKDDSRSDYWMGNFECVCSEVTDKQGTEEYRRNQLISSREWERKLLRRTRLLKFWKRLHSIRRRREQSL